MMRGVCAVLCAGLMCSCTAHHANERLVLGGRYRTGSFDGGISVINLKQTARPRSAWTSTVVVAPTDGTVTGQTLRTPNYLRPEDPPRLYGRFPTIDDVLDAQQLGWGRGFWWAMDVLGRSIGEVVLMPYRALVYSISEPETWSPERAWKRRPVHDAWSSGQPRMFQGASDDDANE